MEEEALRREQWQGQLVPFFEWFLCALLPQTDHLPMQRLRKSARHITFPLSLGQLEWFFNPVFQCWLWSDFLTGRAAQLDPCSAGAQFHSCCALPLDLQGVGAHFLSGGPGLKTSSAGAFDAGYRVPVEVGFGFVLIQAT